MKAQSQIRSLVRRQLMIAIQADLDGDEQLMKEVWEECETDDHEDAVKLELEEVLEFLREREARLNEEGT